MAPFFAWPMLWLTLPALVWLIDGASSEPPPTRWRPRASPPPRSAGGSASAISWPACSGSARRSWSRRRSSPGSCRLRSRCCRRGLALFYAAATGIAARFWRPGPSRVAGAGACALGHGVAARARPHGLSLERARLRADLSPAADAERRRPRHLRADADRRPRLRPAGGPVERGARPDAPAAARASPRLPSPWCRWPSWRSRPGPPDAGAAGVGAGRQDPHRAAERAAAREVAAGEPAAHLPRSPGSCRRPTPPASVDDLAGITHVVWPEAAMPFMPLDHPDVRAAIGRLLPPATPPHHRRAARGAGAAGHAAAVAHLQQPARVRRGRVAGRRSTTRSTSCRSASTCRCSRCSRRSGCEQLTRLRGGFDNGVMPRPLLRVPGLPAAAPLICYEAIFPRAIVQGAERPGAHAQSSPTTAGSAIRRARASTCTRRACARWRRVCRSCAPPTTAFPR